MDETIIQLEAELDHALAEHRRLAEEIALLADQTESTNEDPPDRAGFPVTPTRALGPRH